MLTAQINSCASAVRDSLEPERGVWERLPFPDLVHSPAPECTTPIVPDFYGAHKYSSVRKLLPQPRDPASQTSKQTNKQSETGPVTPPVPLTSPRIGRTSHLYDWAFRRSVHWHQTSSPVNPLNPVTSAPPSQPQNLDFIHSPYLIFHSRISITDHLHCIIHT